MSVRQGTGYLTVVKDLLSFLFGWGLIFSQAGIWPFDPPSHASELIILVGTVAVGFPGVSHLLAARFGGTPTAPPSSPPQAEAPSPSSSGA